MATKPPKQPMLLDVKARPQSEQEVICFCLAQKLTAEDGKYLWHHWQANHFKIGSQPIKDWHAVIYSWKSAGFFPSQKNAQRTQEPTVADLRFAVEHLKKCAEAHPVARDGLSHRSPEAREQYKALRKALRNAEEKLTALMLKQHGS